MTRLPATLPHVLLAAAVAMTMTPAPARAQHPWSGLSGDRQIELALQAAPADMREHATVQGYDAEGRFVTLRQGTGILICMAPDPTRDAFEVSCHYRGLEPFFARGRELLAQGITGRDRVQRRWDEYTAGKLPIPYGAISYIVHGSGFEPETGEVTDPYRRWTVYTPNATPETTGLSTDPGSGIPWLMFPGTPGAHIMITPPRG